MRPSPLAFRRYRLLSTTALVASTLGAAGAAQAQLSPNARPAGGQVVAGGASISTAPNATVIDQSTSRAAINWQSFNVGTRQSVDFHQPSASAVVLNRVTGPDPSAIAGRIDANGQVVITNPSGVVFSRGSQVNAQSLVVSAAGITNGNFMAGRMVFDQAPNPNARIVNRGTITVRQAGLAALVAPSVANRGVIDARLGRVVLAGAKAETLDLYGDGLVSFDVSSQVTQVPVGRGGRHVAALVTNEGTIAADGGTVELTAAAADGVIQRVVDARGTIRADTAAGRTGQIAINGLGGAVVIDGVVQANGAGGGGTVAIGTDLARAQGTGTFPADTSEMVVVGRRARISANGIGRGRGGRVTVLSTAQTTIAGTIEAKGGALAGNGGTIELSGEHGFSLTGPADASAPHGDLGTIILDPTDLLVVPNSGTTSLQPIDNGGTQIPADYGTGTATVTEASIEALTGNIHLQALDDLVVEAPLSLGSRNIVLEAGNDLTVTSAATISANDIGLAAASPNIAGFNSAGALTVAGTLIASGTAGVENTGSIVLYGGTGGVLVTGLVQTTSGDGAVIVDSQGPLAESGGGAIVTQDLEGNAADVSLLSSGNQIAAVGENNGFVVTGTTGNFLLEDSTPLTLGGSFSSGPVITVGTGQAITLIDDQVTAGGELPKPLLSAQGGTITIAPSTSGLGITLTTADAVSGLGLTTQELEGFTADVLVLGTLADGRPTAGDVTFDGSLDLGSLGFSALQIEAAGSVTQNAPLGVQVLSGQAGTLALTDAGNFIGTLDGFVTDAGSLALHSSETLFVTGPLVAQGGTGFVDLSSSAGPSEEEGVVRADAEASIFDQPGIVIEAGIDAGSVHLDTTNDGEGLGILQTAGSITAGTLTGAGYSATLEGANAIGTLADFSTTGSLAVNDAVALTLDGAVGSAFGTVVLSAPGIVQVGGTLLAGELDGSSGEAVALAQTGNVVDAVGSFVLTGGAPFSLVTSAGTLAFTGSITGSASALRFEADDVAFDGGTIGDAGGTVIFAPFTGGREIALTVEGAGSAAALALDAFALAAITTGTLALETSGGVVIGNGGEAVPLGDQVSALFLQAGTVTEGAGAGLTVDTLSGTVGSLMLDGPNAIGTVGGVTATGAFDLVDGGPTAAAPLTIDGPLNAGEVTISDFGVLTAEGGISAATVTLTSSSTTSGTASDLNSGIVLAAGQVVADLLSLGGGSIEETGGSIAAGTLTGASGNAELRGSNTIGTLEDFSGGNFFFENGGGTVVPDNLALDDTAALTIVGTVDLSSNGAGSTLSLNVATLSIDGTVNAGTLDLETSGSVSGNTGAVDVDTLTGSVGGLDLEGNNLIGTLGALTSSGTLVLTDGGPDSGEDLVVGGPVSANTLLSITDFGALTLAGTVSVGGTAAQAVQLATEGSFDGGGITQTGGIITAGTLTGAAFNATLDGANAIGTLGDFDASSDLVLNDTQALVLDGTITGAFVSLYALGIEQSGGLLSAFELDGSSSGLVSLDETANQIGAIGSFALGNGATFSLVTSSPTLAFDGPLTGSASALSVTADGLAYEGGTIADPGGIVTFAPLTAGREIELIAADSEPDGNTMSIDGSLLGAISAGTLALVTSGEVLVRDAVSLAGDVSTLFVSAGSVAEGQTGSGLTVGTLSGTVAGGATLAGANSVDVLSGFSAESLTLIDRTDLAAGGVLVTNAGTISSAGTLLLTGNVSASTLALSGDAIVQSGGTVEATGTGLDLTLSAAGGAIIQTGGVVLAGTVSIVAGTADLGDANSVAALDGVQVGTLALNDTGNLLLTGPVGVGQGTFDVSGTLSSAPGWTPSIGILSGAVGSADLSFPGGPGGLGTLGDLSGTLGISLASEIDSPLLVVGTVSAPDVALSAIAIDDEGLIGGATVALDAFGQVSGNGRLAAGLLVGSASGLTLLSGGNSVDAIGDFNAGGGTFALADGAPALTMAGTVSAASATLLATGAVAETGGVLAVGTLSGSGASFALGGANSVGTLGALSASGSVALADGVPLQVDGVVSASAVSIADDQLGFGGGGTLEAPGGFVQLAEDTPGAGLALSAETPELTRLVAGTLVLGDAAGGPVTIAGTFDLSGIPVLDLLSSGGITENGGGLVVGTLEAAAGGAIALGGNNRIAALGSVSSNGDLTIADGVDLRIMGPVVSGGTLTLNDSGVIAQAGGSVSAGLLTGSAGGLELGGPGNMVGSLGPFAAATTLALADAESLTVAGPLDPPDITLSTAGDLTLDSGVTGGLVSLTAGGRIAGPGTVTATVLTGRAGADAAFAGAAVGTLDGFAAGSTLTLTDTVPLVVAGRIAAPDLAISAPGTLTVEGGTIATNGLPPAAESGAMPSPPGSFLQVLAGPDGRGTFDQLGTTSVEPDMAGASTLRMGIPAAGGTLTLAGLQAPDTTIILGPGTGTATGTLDAGGLLVLDEGGRADLSGSVASVSGSDAAALSQIVPSPDILYTLNGCEIAASCVSTDTVLSFEPVALSLLQPEIVQGSLVLSIAETEREKRAAKTPLLTLQTLDLAVGRDSDDATIQLPNISDRDY